MRQSFSLPYGKGFIDLSLDPSMYDVTVILPEDPFPVNNPKELFLKKSASPQGAVPLKKLVSDKQSTIPSVVIVVSDHTRPVPDHLLVPWIVSELGIDDSRVTVLVGTGTHRGSTPLELSRMLGKDVLNRFDVIVHDCKDEKNLTQVGTSRCGGPCLLHKRYVDADIKIATGFIEPHLFAGFSGGAKAIVPGIAGLETISYFHRAGIIANPLSTWGNTNQNPVLDLSRDMTSLCPPDCIVNVTMNLKKQITGLFIGDTVTAHDSGCSASYRQSCTLVRNTYPVVITTNSGYPLDMNFYQTVKGISAAATIVEQGGTIIIVSECGNGIPDNSEFETILSQDIPTEDLLAKILANDKTPLDQWQVQVLLHILQKCNVRLYSSLNKEKVVQTRVEPVMNIENTLREIRLSQNIERLPVAVMPYGPLTIPVN